MHHKKIGLGFAFACWTFLFTPTLLEGLSPTSIGLWLASAFLFWFLSLWRPLLLPACAVLLVLGVINIMHVAFLGGLADQMFLATVARTNWEETREFAQVIPWTWGALAVLWLALAVLAARQVWRSVPALPRQGVARRAAWIALAIWVVFLAFVLVKRYTFEEVARKVKTIYPMHIVRAWTAQKQLSDAMFYVPALPEKLPAADRVNTLVVVLGESASAARWSLLGYEGVQTNAPLQAIEGLETIRVMSHGLNTAAALPYLLTGMTAEESAQKNAPSFLDLAKQAGYKVFVFSNSRYHSSHEDFYGVILRRSADVYQKAGNGEWDEVLTQHLRDALADPAAHKLVVLHTYGSHFQVEERYPDAHAKFADAYDNTMYYTSDLLAQWIGMLQRNAGEVQSAMLLYSSDHGVAMPPCADQYRTGSGLSSLEVPMLFWGNRVLKEREPALWPEFAAQERQTLMRSNAVVAELAAQAVGYPHALDLPADSPAKQLTYQGLSWQELQKRDACSLK